MRERFQIEQEINIVNDRNLDTRANIQIELLLDIRDLLMPEITSKDTPTN